MNLSIEPLNTLTHDVWEVTLGIPVHDCAASKAAPRDQRVCWAVDISGATCATVVLCVPMKAARVAASVMFGAPEELTTSIDAADAIAELTNITGGNMKSLLPGPNKLSIPREMSCSELEAMVVEQRLSFRMNDSEFNVMLVMWKH